jgi:hypothetical protein
MANMTAAVAGMSAEGTRISQNIQTYITHQQALGTELSLFGNLPIINIQQQLTAIQTSIQNVTSFFSAR